MIPGTVVIGGGATPLGYQQISAATLAASTGLTIPAGATIALVQIDTAPVRWRDDGTAPTASIGMQIAAAGSLAFGGASLFAVRFIAASGSPILNASFY
jgi:hypothetical protein